MSFPHHHDDYDPAAVADRSLYREREHMTAGASAFHAMDPAEIVMRIEERNPVVDARAELWMLRNEVFAGFIEYIFADGPAPVEVRARLEGFFRSFLPELAEKIKGPHEWVDVETVAMVLQKHRKKLLEVAKAHQGRGSLSRWYAELEREVDFDAVRELLVELVKLMASEGKTWRNVTAVAYCIAKALRPSLIAGMSLDDIALLSGDEGGRATPQNRLKRIYNNRVEAAGFKACHVHFQKSEQAVRAYRKAQQGNKNRKMKRRKIKPKKKI